MEKIKRYKVIYSVPAREDLLNKAAYIEQSYLDPDLSRQWFQRLWDAIHEELSYLPYKYPVYNQGQWQGQGVHVFTIRNDIVLYEIDEDNAAVYIRNIFTRGKDLTRD